MQAGVFSIDAIVADDENARGVFDNPPRWLDVLPIAIIACGADGQTLWTNRQAEALLGPSPFADSADGPAAGERGIHPSARALVRQSLATGRPIDAARTLVGQGAAGAKTALLRVSLVIGARGEVIGAINSFSDIREVDAAAAAAGEQWFRAALEALPVAIYTTDETGLINFYNTAAAELAGRRPNLGTDRWCVSRRLWRADGTLIPHDACPMAVAVKEDRAVRGVQVTAERQDGSRVVLMPYPTPLHDSNGRLIGAVNMLVDITRRQQTEKRMTLLAREVDHRAKNMLAVIQAMVRFTRAETPEDFATIVQGRISALAHAHTLLSESRWKGADLKLLAEEELAAHRGDDADRVSISGSAVALVPSVAQSLAIVLHELTTNTVRHGALSTSEGRVALNWSRDDSGDLVLDWRETASFTVRAPKRHGFGMTVIERTITDQLDGDLRLDWGKDGLRCALRIPHSTLRPPHEEPPP